MVSTNKAYSNFLIDLTEVSVDLLISVTRRTVMPWWVGNNFIRLECVSLGKRVLRTTLFLCFFQTSSARVLLTLTRNCDNIEAAKLLCKLLCNANWQLHGWFKGTGITIEGAWSIPLWGILLSNVSKDNQTWDTLNPCIFFVICFHSLPQV